MKKIWHIIKSTIGWIVDILALAILTGNVMMILKVAVWGAPATGTWSYPFFVASIITTLAIGFVHSFVIAYEAWKIVIEYRKMGKKNV